MRSRLQICLIFCVALPYIGREAMGLLVSRRSVVPDTTSDDYPDYLSGVKYDEYPVSSLQFIFKLKRHSINQEILTK